MNRSALARRSALGGALAALVLAALLPVTLAGRQVPPAEAPKPAEAAPQAPAPEPARARTVILLRHAEKEAVGEVADPDLSGAGRERAARLAEWLAPSGPTALFATEYLRTKATLAPLAQALKLEVQSVPGRDPAQLVQRLEALPEGSVAVVAGHSNTVPELVKRLGGQASAMPEDVYDRVYVLTIPPPELRSRLAVTTLLLSSRR